MASTYSAALARHVLTLKHDDIPAGTRRHAVKLITDAIGNGIYGAGTDAGQAVHQEAQVRYRGEGAQVWGRREHLAPAGAALVNATQAHAYELDDYLPAGKVHPGTVIIPAALAIANDDVTGAELVTAVVAAYDVLCRVALAMNPTFARERGFHLTGLAGPFGAAAVAGRLLNLDESTLISALGVAASCSAGVFAFSAEGAMTKPLHAGRAAEAGIVAAALAQRGFQGPTAALEAKDGGLLKAVSDAALPTQLTKELGKRFDLANVAIKPYPCCGSIHSSIDAVLTLQRRHSTRLENPRSVTVHNAGSVILQCGFEYTGKGGPLEAQMSLQYCLAVALMDGQVGLGQFTEQRRRDDATRKLASRVDFVFDPEIDTIYPKRFPARVRIQCENGEIVESEIDAPLGTRNHPMTDEQLHLKFSDLTANLISTTVRDRLITTLQNLDSEISIGAMRNVLWEATEPTANILPEARAR